MRRTGRAGYWTAGGGGVAGTRGGWATTTRRTTNTFLSALSKALPFLHSRGSFFAVLCRMVAASCPFHMRIIRRAHVNRHGGPPFTGEDRVGPCSLCSMGGFHCPSATTVPTRHRLGSAGVAAMCGSCSSSSVEWHPLCVRASQTSGPLIRLVFRFLFLIRWAGESPKEGRVAGLNGDA